MLDFCGIILSDIIPALIRFRPNGEKFPQRIMRIPPEGKHINALSMDEGHGIISKDIIPAPVRRPTEGRTSSLANRVHAPQGNMSEGHGIMSVG